MKFSSIRFGHAVGAHFNKKIMKTRKKRQNAGCNTGDFIKSPAAGETVQTSSPFTISWDTSCLSTSTVDIYLTSPSSGTPLHIWNNVAFAPGTFTTTLKPKWYNATSTVSLQLTLVQAGTPQYLSPFPAGAPFNAAYTPPAVGAAVPDAANTATPDAIAEDVSASTKSSKGISGGGIAAAVIVPLLVIALAVGIYIRFQRQKRNTETRRYSRALDARMSQMNPDWQAMDPQAQLAFRQSVAAYRMSGPMMNRPASAFPSDGGRAGVGAGYYDEYPEMMESARPESQFSISGAGHASVYATDARIPARAFHQGHVPPQLQHRRTSEELLTSPTQTNGPLTLTPDDIRSRVAAADESERESLDDVLPALSVMRTGLDNDALLVAPAPPAAVASSSPKSLLANSPSTNHSNNNDTTGTNSNRSQFASPDDMMRQYAALRSPGSPAFPAPAYNGSGMRVLYGGKEQGSNAQKENNRASMATVATTRYSMDDPYAGH